MATPNFNMGYNKIGIPKVKLKPLWKTFREFGSEFERKVQRNLRDKGYEVSKPHNKHYDIHATKDGKTYIVECKCNKANFSQEEVAEAISQTRMGNIYLIARENDNGRIVYIDAGDYKTYKKERKERVARAKKRESNQLGIRLPRFGDI